MLRELLLSTLVEVEVREPVVEVEVEVRDDVVDSFSRILISDCWLRLVVEA